MFGGYWSSGYWSSGYQVALATTPAPVTPTGGGGHKEWTRGFFKIPEEYRERIEETLEEAAQDERPVAAVTRTVDQLLRKAALEQARRREYAALYAEAYLELLRVKQQQEQEIAQVIAMVLLH